MNVSRSVLRRAAELADAGVSFALCTVLSARGSLPGKAGAKMIVTADGAQFGTVGGAGLEERTKALGLACLASRKGGVHRFDLSYHRIGNSPGALDSLCGGSVEILVEYMGGVLTAGHNLSGSGLSSVTAQFNVPKSDASGAIVHPPARDQYDWDSATVRFQHDATGDWGLLRFKVNSTTALYAGEAQYNIYDIESPPALQTNLLSIVSLSSLRTNLPHMG